MHFCLFETPVGSCAIAWNDVGVIGVNLPEASDAALRKRMKSRFADVRETTPTAKLNRIIKQVVALLSGKPADLSGVSLDLSAVPAFHQQVYALVRTVPAGSTLSYGEVAARLGKPGAARAVGQAMGRNPFPIIMPCHRVLAANGKLGGFTAFGSTDTKLRILQIEGVQLGKPVKPAAKANKPIRAFNARAALKHLRASDAALSALIDRIGPYTLELNETHDLFLALARAIVYQQLHGKAAATILQRVIDLFPRTKDGFTANDIARCADDKLRGAGLSQNKLLALRDLATKTLDGTLPSLDELHALDDETIIERLIKVRGIGRWTVEMLLMFRLGRMDVLPIDDFGVRKGYMLAFKKKSMPTPKELKAYGERWAPYRSVASWYFWRAADEAKAGR
ncbi:MAG: methylated-DNA--[protein]-cysteine S-methyltransferase [Steroidobacteraceae bacterium]